MCHVVTLGVEKDAVEAVEALGRDRGGFRFVPEADAAPSFLFPKSAHLFLVLHGQCSCDIVGLETPEDDLARRRDKYRRKGWSEAKIERALQAHAADRTERPRPYVGRFIDAVAELVRGHGPVWLLVQWSPERSDEPTPPATIMALSVEEFRALQGAYPEGQVMRIAHGGITTR